MASISINAFNGSVFTAKQERLGGSLVKYFPKN